MIEMLQEVVEILKWRVTESNRLLVVHSGAWKD